MPEDPVCGSGHCHIIPFWAIRLSKNELVATKLQNVVEFYMVNIKVNVQHYLDTQVYFRLLNFIFKLDVFGVTVVRSGKK